MSYSVEQTRRQLPWLLLALPVAAMVVLAYPRPELLTDLRLVYLLPVWIVLAHPLTGLSYAITNLSLRSAFMLLKGSFSIYSDRASLTHLAAAFLTALLEEVVFRYAALSYLVDALDSPAAGLVISSLLFSLAHLRLGFRWKNLLRYVDLFVLGLVLGGCRLAFASLYPALLLHGMRNTILRGLLISRAEYERLHEPSPSRG